MNKSNQITLTSIMNRVVTASAYIILGAAILVLTYLSFVETINTSIDWKTVSIFSGATILLSYSCWTMFYKKQYEQILNDDLQKVELGKYSIQLRYRNAITDWSDKDLQDAVDKFNKDYVDKWLREVESKTGVPIQDTPIFDSEGNEVGQTKGILNRPYRKFPYKYLMWRVKHHKYPTSGYKSSMELLSLISYQDSDFNKRKLRADKTFFIINCSKKVFSSGASVIVGASIVPEMISGDYFTAFLKLIIAIVTLLSSVITGAVAGIKGGRIKLSIIEDTSADIERWGNKKPSGILLPKVEPTPNVEAKAESTEINMSIFDKLKSQK